MVENAGRQLLAEARRVGLQITTNGDVLHLRGPATGRSVVEKIRRNKIAVLVALDGLADHSEHPTVGQCEVWLGFLTAEALDDVKERGDGR